MEITYIDLIAFKNGVFDFQERRFRKIRPDDNCDVTLEYDYKEFMENSNEMKEIDNLLGKIYVDTNIREVFLDLCVSLLRNDYIEKQFFIFFGTGNNGKSKIKGLLQAIFGSYCVNCFTPDIDLTENEMSEFKTEICEEYKNSKLFIFDMYNYYLNKKFVRDVMPMFNSIIILNLNEPVKNIEIANVEIAYWKRAKFIPHESVFEMIKAEVR